MQETSSTHLPQCLTSETSWTYGMTEHSKGRVLILGYVQTVCPATASNSWTLYTRLNNTQGVFLFLLLPRAPSTPTVCIMQKQKKKTTCVQDRKHLSPSLPLNCLPACLSWGA
ncbi:hypothetical protein VTJ04DRAFT_2604 [Mycothermus thermophilus]|uniref:uncharacterized protein n=1 Tax=Humicola insolens TaxID=85995 RepID=UPI0037449857